MLLNVQLNRVASRFRLSPDLDLAEFAKRCPFNYTGADFYALCSDGKSPLHS